MKARINLCVNVPCIVHRFLNNMGKIGKIVPPVPRSVFELAEDDIVGTFGSAMKL